MEEDEGGGKVVDCRRDLAVAQLAIGKGAAAGKEVLFSATHTTFSRLYVGGHTLCSEIRLRLWQRSLTR